MARATAATKAADSSNDTGLPDDIWQRLAAPFPADEIELLPRNVKKDDREYHDCKEGPGLRKASKDGIACGGRHAWSIHLHYVGHAGITTRLNEVVGPDGWSWEPAYMDPTPEQQRLLETAIATGNTDLVALVFDNVKMSGRPRGDNNGMWIRLTILGVTKLGFGDAAGKNGPNATKELIGDALRNAAMRFGVGAYLWSKSDKSAALKEQHQEESGPALPDSARVEKEIGDAVKAKDPLDALKTLWDRYGEDVLARVDVGNGQTAHDLITLHATRLRRTQAQDAAEGSQETRAQDAPAPARDAQPDAQPDAPADAPTPEPTRAQDAPPAQDGVEPVRALWLDELRIHAHAHGVEVNEYVGPLLEHRNAASLGDVSEKFLGPWLVSRRRPAAAALRRAGQQTAAERLDKANRNEPAHRGVLFADDDTATAPAEK